MAEREKAKNIQYSMTEAQVAVSLLPVSELRTVGTGSVDRGGPGERKRVTGCNMGRVPPPYRGDILEASGAQEDGVQGLCRLNVVGY